MKKIKIIIGVIIGLVATLIMISGLFNKKEQEVVIEQTTIGNKAQINNNTTTSSTTTTKKVKTTKKVVKTTKKVVPKKVVKSTSGYKLTHYGYDCKGCGGKTATGYDISKTIYYNDSTYGKVRIVAMCSKYPLYSIIKIKNYKMGGDITAIVLDRGVGCSTIDLAVKNEKTSSQYGIQNNVKIEILRNGK